ncbi:hypothetical protein RIF29_38353 [Crotalaria pallida]|uniref:Uncharacterized protein n=1 Tax=Crotalaria pallida TaxID=3830 RepID=A0AAN9E108_CROPI
MKLACGWLKALLFVVLLPVGLFDAVGVVKLLVSASADISCVDADGNHPADVIVVPFKLQSMKEILAELLSDGATDGSVDDCFIPLSANSSSPGSTVRLSSLEYGLPSSPSGIPPSPVALKFIDATEKKEYPIDSSLPDIKTTYTRQMSFASFHFRSFLVPGNTLMIGLSVLLFILERMLKGETPESSITAVFRALILERGFVDVGICVNMLTEYLSAGCTQLSIGQGSVKMVLIAT